MADATDRGPEATEHPTIAGSSDPGRGSSAPFVKSATAAVLPGPSRVRQVVTRLLAGLTGNSKYDAVAVVFCCVAASVAWRQVHDLRWPCESDFYRDLGTDQAFLDGRIGGDPGYLGEHWWYPPLVPAIVALTTWAFDAPLYQTYTIGGVFLNVFAPLGLYALVSTLCNRRVAVFSLTGFLFFPQLDLMSWLNATYSPWLWPCNFAQGIFFGGLAATITAFRSGGLVTASIAGALIGLTMLAHAAPALLLGGAVVAIVLRQLLLKQAAHARARVLVVAALISGVAALVAAPYLWTLAVDYRLKVKNPAPLTWVAGELALERAHELLERVWSVRGVFGVIGLGAAMLGRASLRDRIAAAALAAWGLFAALGLAYGFVGQARPLPPLFPSWHFYFYLQAFESVMFGAGIFASAELLRSILTRSQAFRRYPPETLRSGLLALSALILAVIIVQRWDRYATRPDLVANRQASFSYAALKERELYTWALQHAKPSDVILADVGPSFFIAAANRKVLALPDLFSNPYVRLEPRVTAARVMLDELLTGKLTKLPELAHRYQVRYVALPAHQREQVKGTTILKRVHKARDARDGFDVYRLKLP